jgi:hypothetical protein
VGDADCGDDCQGSSGRFDSHHKKPTKAICREFRLSRKVARKVIRSEAREFHYKRRRQSLPRIDPWREQLDALLLANEERPTVQLVDFGQPHILVQQIGQRVALKPLTVQRHSLPGASSR